MESLQEILDLVFEKLQDSMNPTAYAAWIKGIEPLKMEGSTVYLQVQTQFKRDQIIGRYLDLIAASFEDVVGFPVEVVTSINTAIRSPCGETGGRILSPEIYAGGNGQKQYRRRL